MSRYHIRKEVYKNGRKTEVQWAIVDDAEDRVIARYGTEKRAAQVIEAYEKAKGEDEDSQ